MAVAVIETLTTTSGSATSLSLDTNNFTPNPSVGDVLISHFMIGANSVTITLPSGWTQINKTENAGDAITSQTAYKIADSSDAAGQSLTWNTGGGAVVMKLAMMRITGHRTINQIAASSGQANDVTTTITAPTVTPTIPDSLILFFASADSSSNSVSSYALTTSSPTFTELYDDNANNYCFSGAWGVRPAITATGNGTATTAVSGHNVGQLVVVSAPQSGSTSDTVTITDSGKGALTGLTSDTITVIESFSNGEVARLWNKPTKPTTNWHYPNE